MATEIQPYIGPRPYEREDTTLFFGRDYETEELLSLIVSYRELLFYAQSGTGKTSLLNARIIPLLEEEEFEILPLARVQGVIPKDIQPDEIKNLYVFNTLMSWAKEETNPRRFVQMSLPEFLKERKRPTDNEGQPLARALIFDQFEELFTLYQDRWKDRNEFFEQVRDALRDDDRLLRVIFTIREDLLAELDPYAPLLPGKLRIRFRLERLRRDAALSAITGPLRGTKRSFAKGIAEKLVEDLLKTRVETITGETIEVIGEFVEPVQLQVVCHNLWQELPPDVTEITEQHLLEFGGIDRPLSRFYEAAVKAAAEQTGIDEEKLRQWCEKWLITSTGTRNIVHRGPQQTEGIPNTALDILADKHLINLEWRAGARWYELTHDRFVDPIIASNKRWKEEREEIVKNVELRKSQGRIKLLSIALIALVIIGISGGILYATRFNPAQQGNLQAQATVAVHNSLTARAQATAAYHNSLTAQAQATAAYQKFLTAQAGLSKEQAIYKQDTNGNPALNDPLSGNDANNWDEGSSVEGNGCTFTGGVYHAGISTQNTVQQCFAKGTSFSNFAFQVQMTIIKGDGGGLIFRAQGVNSSYRFRIGIDGTYDFFIPSTGTHPIISNTSNPAIKKGPNQFNLLTVIASGNNIYLYVNGYYLGIVRDSTYSSGEIGLFAFDSTNPTDVAFSNAKVWEL